MHDESQNVTPAHANSILELEETRNLLHDQIKTTAQWRVRYLQLEAEVASLRPQVVPAEPDPESEADQS